MWSEWPWGTADGAPLGVTIGKAAGQRLPGAAPGARGEAWPLRHPCWISACTTNRTSPAGTHAWSHVTFELSDAQNEGMGHHLVVMKPGDALGDPREKPSGLLTKFSVFKPRAMCKSCRRKVASG